MAVAWVRRDWKQRGGSFGNPAEQTDKIHYLVKVTDKFDTAITIRNSGMLPAFLAQHPEDPTLTRRELTIDPIPESPFFWHAAAHYSSAPLGERDRPTEINPLLRPMVVRVSAHETERFVIHDKNGRQMTTSASEPYEPIAIDDTRFLIECELNVASIPSWFLTGRNRTNQDEFQITFVGGPKTFAVGTCQFKPVSLSDPITVEIEGAGSITYAVLRFNLDYRDETWKYRPEDKGFWFIHDNGDVYHIVWQDEHKQWHKVDQPQYLDGEGKLLVPINSEVDPEQIVFREFEPYKQMVFSGIPFP